LWAVSSTACLSADTLVELVEGRASDATFDRALAHASSCAACRGLLSTLARGDTLSPTTLVDRLPATAPARPAERSAETSRPSMLAIGSRVGRFQLEHLLGAGGMGYVYAARDPELDRMVALKLLRPDLESSDGQNRLHERLRREAQAMAKLAHPNVVAVHDVGTFEDRVFVAMEYIEGDTLQFWVDGKTPRQIVDAYIEAGRGLAAAHAAGLVHRDFKPENALVGRDGRVRVGDFGLARTIDRRLVSKDPYKRPVATGIALTRTGLVMGTPLYMAPEQYRGEPADKRSDQFSFCVALHGALYGERPFTGDTFEELAESVLTGAVVEPKRRARISRRVRDAIRRGMSLDPEARWASMDALLGELAPRRASRAWWLVGAGASAAVVAGAIVMVATRGSEAPPPSCDRAYLAGVWDDSTKAAIRTSLVATKLPYADATATAIDRAGDRFAAAWTGLRVGACEAHAKGDLHNDAYALETTCLTLRKRDLEATVTRLRASTSAIAPRAADAIDALPPVGMCTDRALLQLLLGPNDPAVRASINHVIGALHGIRAATALGDESMRTRLDVVVAQARTIDAPAVRAEVLGVAGEYAAAVSDFVHARDWLAQAADDASLGHHDLAEARARIAQLVVTARDLDQPATPDAAALAVRRLHHRSELEIALAIADADVASQAKRSSDAVDRLHAAIALADRTYPDDDLRRIPPRRALAETLVAAHQPAEAVLGELVARQRKLLGPDHPDVATAMMWMGDATADRVLADATYAEAEAVATRAADPAVIADIVERRARIARDPAKATALYAKAIALDGTAHTLAAIRRLMEAAAAAPDRTSAKALYERARTAITAALPADDPRLAEVTSALAAP
jgi:predicted Ser/Thr protein kinase